MEWTMTRRKSRQKLVEAPMPRSWHKFERIISYLRRYVEGFAKIAKPLNGLLGWHPYIYLDDFSEPCCLEVDASLKGLYHTSVGMLRGLLKLQNHWIVYLPQVLPSPRRSGISPTNGRQSVRMRLMPWSGNLLKHPYLDDFSEPCCLEVDASLKGLYHTSVGMLRGLLKLQTIEWPTWMTSLYILGRLQWTMLPRSWRKF